MSYHKSTELNYPSPAEVKIYLNNNWVDDAYRIEYTLSNQRTPLYDYTSQYFKGVAEGTSIIQGQLIINFRFPGYLEYAIHQQLVKDSNVLKPLNEAADVFNDLLKGSDQERIQRLLAYKKAGSLGYAKQLLKYTGEDSNKSSVPNRAISHKTIPFNIQIKYGGEEALHVKILKDCYIIGEAQVISASSIAGGDLSASGMPIYEQYSFFAKEVIDQITERAERLRKFGGINRYGKSITETGIKVTDL